MNAPTRVSDFLLPLDPIASLLSIGESLIDTGCNSELASLVDVLHMRLTSPLVNPKHEEVYERIRGGGATFEIPQIPEFAQPVFLVLYLRARAAMKSAMHKSIVSDLRSRLPKPEEVQRFLDPEFLGELLIEAGLRTLRDSSFQAVLSQGASEIRSAVPYFEDLSKRLATVLSRESGFCQICGTDVHTGQPRCVPAGFWTCLFLLLLLIILIITA